jgi:enoyl-CoA hydratase/carnithine racemase
VAAGLFARSLPAGEVLDFTRAMAARVAAGPTGAFLASRRQVALLRDARAGLWDSMAAEAKAQGELAGTDDYLEGFRAFQEKRAPVFRR